jgi:hypothetical protein
MGAPFSDKRAYDQNLFLDELVKSRQKAMF